MVSTTGGFPEIPHNISLRVHCPDFSHVVIPNSKSGWEMKSLFQIVICQEIITKE